jgi:hypothetical protein
MSTAETTEIRHNIVDMRRCVRALMLKYGDVPAVRRLLLDLDRMSLDLDDFAQANLKPVQAPPAASAQKIAVPDTPYEQSWMADDEGLGGYRK